jgi:hypothetical protein
VDKSRQSFRSPLRHLSNQACRAGATETHDDSVASQVGTIEPSGFISISRKVELF